MQRPVSHPVIFLLILLCLLISKSASRAPRHSQCTDLSLTVEQRENRADIVLTGTVSEVFRGRKNRRYSCEVHVVRVLKGFRDGLKRSIVVEGLGNNQICSSNPKKGDTRIFMLSEERNGVLKLNSSVIRITLSNLDRTEAAVNDVPFVTEEVPSEDLCARILCGFGATCEPDEIEQKGVCVCPNKCSGIFAPVCGTDEVTYTSECHLNTASCELERRITIKSQGICGARDPCESVRCSYGALCVPSLDGVTAQCVCPQSCDTLSDPVCGDDGVNYSNECEMRQVACQLKQDIAVKYRGYCDPCVLLQCTEGSTCHLDRNRQALCLCGKHCPRDYSPVCASDGQSYNNFCLLEEQACRLQRNLTIVHQGPCGREDSCEEYQCRSGSSCQLVTRGVHDCVCPMECPVTYLPVCGSNNVAYDNECDMRKSACQSKIDIEVTHFGPCYQSDADLCSELNCHFGSVCIVRNGTGMCECNTACTEEYNALCGSDGVSYPNLCRLESAMCEQQRQIRVVATGVCNGCDNMQCMFGAMCEVNDLEGPMCVCPDGCIPVNAPVCGSDSSTYSNECELTVAACVKRENLRVVSQGPCDIDLCLTMQCAYGAQCVFGECICPRSCPGRYEPVCGADGMTYTNLCELKVAACQQQSEIKVIFDGLCEDFDISGSGDAEFEFCDESTCRYGGTCDYDTEGSLGCICDITCPFNYSPVCGTDRMTYSNLCLLRLAMCEKQIQIGIEKGGTCEESRETPSLPCGGHAPLINPLTDKPYQCGGENDSSLSVACPLRSFCHVRHSWHEPLCCSEASTKDVDCLETLYGCCVDETTPAPGLNYAGCPDLCMCNKIGSYATTCDPATGQCSCKPGVGGLKCDRCEPGFWDFRGMVLRNNSGCVPCSCSVGGSVRDDCEQMSGWCVCKAGVSGVKCTICPAKSEMTPIGCETDVARLGVMSPMTCETHQCDYGSSCLLTQRGPECICPAQCEPTFKPVCASDGHTYGNLCQMKVFSCRLKMGVDIVHDGPCQPEHEPMFQQSDSSVDDCSLSTYGCCTDGLTPASSPSKLGCPGHDLSTQTTPIHLSMSPLLSDNLVPTNVSHTNTSLNLDQSFNTTTVPPDPTILTTANSTLTTQLNSTLTETLFVQTTNTSDAQHTIMNVIEISNDTSRKNISLAGILVGTLTSEIFHENTSAPQESLDKILVNSNEPTPDLPLFSLKTSNNTVTPETSLTPSPASEPVTNPLPLSSEENAELNVSNESTSVGTNVSMLNLAILEGPVSSDTLIEFNASFAPPVTRPPSRVPIVPGGNSPHNTATSNAADVRHCEDYPCLHGGSCFDLLLEPFYECLCPVGKGGPDCESDQPFIIPSFSGRSYIAFRKMTDYMKTELVIEFRTMSLNSVLLYSGENLDATGDYIVLMIVNGHPELRYNLGSGAAVLSADTVLSLDRWHKIQFSRNRRDTQMIVDNIEEISGFSPPPLSGLNIAEDLYVGGLPIVSDMLYKTLGTHEGLTGCIRHLSINNKLLNIHHPGSDVLYGADVGECGGDPCLALPCMNSATCVSLDSEMFHCVCGQNHHGAHCEFEKDPCSPNPCQGESVCESTSAMNVISYRCNCPLGRSGPVCGEVINYSDDDLFIVSCNSHSYIEYPKISATRHFTAELWFLPRSRDGVLLFASGTSDFISLNLVDGFLEFRFDLGSGTADIRSGERVSPHNWHKVTLHRDGSVGSMTLNDNLVSGRAQGTLRSLNLDQPLYVCGLYNYTSSPRAAAITDGFNGAIQKLIINDHAYVDLNRYTEVTDQASAAVEIYNYDDHICDLKPCYNNGRCKPVLNHYTCECGFGFSGSKCEITLVDDVSLSAPILFDGSMFIQFQNQYTSGGEIQLQTNVRLSFETVSRDGVLLWIGQQGSRTGDFLVISVSQGFIEFSFELGSGAVTLQSNVPVDDSRWHTLVATRDGRQASLRVDSELTIQATSNTPSTRLNVNNQLWIGGYSNFPSRLPYQTGFTGCMKDFYLNGNEIHFIRDATNHPQYQFCHVT